MRRSTSESMPSANPAPIHVQTIEVHAPAAAARQSIVDRWLYFRKVSSTPGKPLIRPVPFASSCLLHTTPPTSVFSNHPPPIPITPPPLPITPPPPPHP